MHHDIERREAVYKLLTLPDPPELRRRHRHVLEGTPERHLLVPKLAAAFIQAKLLELRERRPSRDIGHA